jgi:hypothetical protein
MVVMTRCQNVVDQVSVPSPTPGPDEPNTGLDIRKSNEKFAIWSNEYTMRTFNDQTCFTRVIFIVVNLLVGAGLYFSWVQFRIASKIVKPSSPQPHVPVASEQANQAAPEQANQVQTSAFPTTDLKFGPDGLSISSAFIGLIILGFSMGFYLMYLKYVYPIKTMGSETPQAVQSESTTSTHHRTE